MTIEAGVITGRLDGKCRVLWREVFGTYTIRIRVGRKWEDCRIPVEGRVLAMREVPADEFYAKGVKLTEFVEARLPKPAPEEVETRDSLQQRFEHAAGALVAIGFPNDTLMPWWKRWRLSSKQTRIAREALAALAKDGWGGAQVAEDR